MRNIFISLLALATAISANPAFAQSVADKGRAIAEKADAADSGWQDAKAGLVMLLATKSGQTATRQLAFQSLETKGGDQSLLRFVAPKDVQDTATMRNIRQNLFFSFLFNGIGVPVAAGVLYPVSGLLMSPMFAGAAMALSSFTVVMNALRLNRLKL